MGRDSKPRIESYFTALSGRTGAKRLSVLEPTLIIPKRRKRYRLRKIDFAGE